MADPPADLDRYYDDVYYQFGPDGEPSWKREPGLLAAISVRVEMLMRHALPGHLIEIGAGTGAFACAAQAAGFRVSAVEMSEDCCRYLRQQDGITSICSDDPAQELSSLKPAVVVAMWHVLEHLPNPADVFERAVTKLQPQGVLAIGVPNPRSFQSRLLGPRWPHLDAPRHLALIPPEALIKRGEELGMRTIEMTTNDLYGLDCNLFGWTGALRLRPAKGPTWLSGQAGHAMCVVLSPLERTANRGSALTLLMQKGP
jgi:SAM-dependent methyltransferase